MPTLSNYYPPPSSASVQHNYHPRYLPYVFEMGVLLTPGINHLPFKPSRKSVWTILDANIKLSFCENIPFAKCASPLPSSSCGIRRTWRVYAPKVFPFTSSSLTGLPGRVNTASASRGTLYGITSWIRCSPCSGSYSQSRQSSLCYLFFKSMISFSLQ